MAVSMATTYEECRLKRVEENRKKMEALNLPQLSHAIRAALSPKPCPTKRIKPRVAGEKMVAVRRSNRLARIPVPSDNVWNYDLEMPGRVVYRAQRRDLSNRVYASEEARAYAIRKAEELQSRLEPNYPTFVRTMLISHVTGGFWLGLPGQFCRTYLPRRDDTITLVDEEGDKYPIVYLARKTGLSGGWKRFSTNHKLVDGDALVFQLTRPSMFKVYIARVNGFKVDGHIQII